MDYCDIESFALETNRDNYIVFEIASKYCISDSFVDHDDRFLTTQRLMIILFFGPEGHMSYSLTPHLFSRIPIILKQGHL